MRFILLFLSLLFLATPARAQPATPATLAFERGGYWLVNPATADFSLRAGHVEKARLMLYRLTNPELLTQVITARAARSLGESELLRRVAEKGDLYWQADFTLDPNTAGIVPVPADIAAGPLPSGIYVLTATPAGDASIRTVQWFMRSPLDLHAEFLGNQVLFTLFDSLARQPRGETLISWLDAQGKVLGQQQTDDSGIALMTQPEGAVVAIAGNSTDEARKHDLAFVDLPATVGAPLNNAVVMPSVARYQPGQGFPVLIAAPGLPDNAEVTAQANKQTVALQLLAPGLWRGIALVPADKATNPAVLTVRANEKVIARQDIAQAVNTNTTVSWQQKPATAVGSVARLAYQFRVTAGGKPVTEGVALQVQKLESAAPDAMRSPGVEPELLPLKNSKGVQLADFSAGQLPRPPVDAQGFYRLTVLLNGQPVGEPARLSVYPAASWLEIKPDFADSAVAEGSAAGFAVQLRTSAGGVQPVPVSWQLQRESYKFEWYQADDGRWTYRTKTDLAKVLDGTTGAKGEAVTVPVGAGRYRFSARDQNGHSASLTFTAGWWLASLPPATPEKIALKAQAEKDAGGQERLAVFVDPPFAARVWLAAVDTLNGAVAHGVVQDIGDEGAFVYLPKDALPRAQPLRLVAFAIPAEPGTGMVQAEGQLTLPLDRGITLAPAQLSGDKPTAAALANLPAGSRAMVDIRSMRSKETIYQSPLTDTATVPLPALAVSGGLQARIIVAGSDNSLSLGEQPLATAASLTIDGANRISLKNGAGSYAATVTANSVTREKLRLVLVLPPDMSLTASPVALGAGKTQSVTLAISNAKPGAAREGYGTLRLETRSGEVRAARPVYIAID